MKAGRGMLGELCFAAEGLSGTAAATSLRKLGSIMESAPSGRLFGAISTLSDMSAKAARALEEGASDIGRNDDTAAARIGEALLHMDGLAEMAGDGHIAVPGKRRAAR
jgi:hypothetical protein